MNYDLLIGADGAHSAVSSYFLNTELFEFEQKYVLTDYKSIILPHSGQLSDLNLASDKIHSWRSNDGIFVVLLHQTDGSMSGVILFPRQNNASCSTWGDPKTALAHEVADLSTPEEVQQFFHERLPRGGSNDACIRSRGIPKAIVIKDFNHSL